MIYLTKLRKILKQGCRRNKFQQISDICIKITPFLFGFLVYEWVTSSVDKSTLDNTGKGFCVVLMSTRHKRVILRAISPFKAGRFGKLKCNPINAKTPKERKTSPWWNSPGAILVLERGGTCDKSWFGKGSE